MYIENKYYRTLFLIALQILAYIIFYNLGWLVGTSLNGKPRNDLNWGITVYYAFILFLFISIISTILSQIVLNQTWKATIFIFLVSFFIFSLFFLNYLTHYPYKTLLILMSGLIGFGSSVCVEMINRSTKG